jgi:proteasome alpha subunit
MEIFEEKYAETISLDKGVDLALEALQKATEENISETTVEIAVIDSDTKTYKKFSNAEVKKHITEVLKKTPKSEEEKAD